MPLPCAVTDALGVAVVLNVERTEVPEARVSDEGVALGGE
tara:strand:- start:2317 stop:2436 length:120 start_codon:yes stop_codon:yes gene_type:complete